MAKLLELWVILLNTIVFLSHIQVSTACKAWKSYKGHCYVFIATAPRKKWLLAQSDCMDCGASLASIGDQAEQNFIYSHTQKFTNETFYIGYNDRTTEGTYEWDDRSPANYTNWAHGEPNSGGSNVDCTYIRSNGSWAVIDCTESKSFICKRINSASRCSSSVSIDGSRNLNVDEDAGTVTVKMKRTGSDLSQPINILVSSSDITAKSPGDYTGLLMNVTFEANNKSSSFNVTIVNDNKLEQENKTFSLTFESSNECLVCNNIPSLNVTIKDDDKVTVEFASTSITVQEDKKKALLEIVKTGTAEIPIQIRLNINNRNSADKNTDYSDRNNDTITILANETKKVVEFEIKDDNEVEGTEKFVVSLEAVDARSTIIGSKSEATVNIEDDDKATVIPVTVEFASEGIIVQEEKKKVLLEIVKNGTAVVPIEIRLNMLKRAFETADKNIDYTDRHNEKITIQPNETKKSVEFEIKDDSTVEGTEVFAVSLEAVDTNTTTIGRKSLAIVLINDKVDQESQAKTQKQKEEDQEKRSKHLLTLLIVCVVILAVLIAAFFILLCLIIKWVKSD